MMLVFRLAPVGLLVSRQRIINHYNTAFSEMFGYDDRELIGQSLERLYPTRHEFEHIGDRASRIMHKQGSYSDDRIMRAKSGHLFWCHVSGRALHRATPLDEAAWAFEDLSARWPVTAELTTREREIAQLLVMGKSSKVIGRELAISPRTVEAHRARLMTKMNATSVSQLVARLIGRG
ncbi:LuxR C-terminal-related transcriptional regulator [Paraburkholderia sp.]|uniref:LuxR C-terminal-related transcriptional regulator n=1 Tax=Paraburkholderia sp. TaxID=1926495 RepID=UPI003C7C5048